MGRKLSLIRVDSRYCDYLRIFDKRVPFNHGNKKGRPFVGVLFEIKGCKYFAPLSSPKAKHLRLKSKMDLLKIDNGKLGVINFNNMIPVNDESIIFVDFENDKYSKLLIEQLYWLNRHVQKIYKMSQKLYFGYLNNKLNVSLRDRCCNFKLLEEKCLEYKSEVGQGFCYNYVC